jgi:hypothetical protein
VIVLHAQTDAGVLAALACMGVSLLLTALPE